jgi:beta-lactamase regulating signal transducer with metallopeptidase domain
LSEIARLLYFFHPVAHWVNHCVRLERELACDQLALAASGRSPAQYAETLVRIVSSISRPSVLRISAAAGLDGSVPLEIDSLNVSASKSPGRQP